MSVSGYSYSRNNPATTSDPNGHHAVDDNGQTDPYWAAVQRQNVQHGGSDCGSNGRGNYTGGYASPSDVPPDQASSTAVQHARQHPGASSGASWRAQLPVMPSASPIVDRPVSVAQRRIASDRVVPRRRGIVPEFDQPSARPQFRVMEQIVHQGSGPADTRPIVIPQRRDQPTAIRGEHQIRQVPRPERAEIAASPGCRLIRSSLNEYVGPARVERHPGRLGKHDVISAGLQVSEPPPLIRAVSAQHRQERLIVSVLSSAVLRQDDGGIGVEHFRDRGRDRSADRGASSDPRAIRDGAQRPARSVADHLCGRQIRIALGNRVKCRHPPGRHRVPRQVLLASHHSQTSHGHRERRAIC